MLKAKLYAIGGAIVAALLVTFKFLIGSRARAVKKAERLEGALKRHGDIQDADSELSKDYQSEKAKIVKEIENDEEVTSLSNPNQWD